MRFRVGLSERVGVRAALFVPRRAVFRIAARTARTTGPTTLSGGPAAALPGTRWWVAVTVGCDISSISLTIFQTFEFL